MNGWDERSRHCVMSRLRMDDPRMQSHARGIREAPMKKRLQMTLQPLECSPACAAVPASRTDLVQGGHSSSILGSSD